MLKVICHGSSYLQYSIYYSRIVNHSDSAQYNDPVKAEIYYKLKLFTEAAKVAKSCYDNYKKDEKVFNQDPEQKGLSISAFILGRCLMVSSIL